LTEHRYQRGAIMADYARGGVGLAVSGLPIIATPLATTVLVIFSGLATLFGVYVIRTWLRASQAIVVDGDGIRRTGPQSLVIPWDDLDYFEVRYFSTRRDREGGWMELKVAGAGRKLALESSLDGFDTVVHRCLLVARRNGLTLSETTQDNLRAMGLLGPAEDANDREDAEPGREG
jgi:hypothetical protein